MSEESSTEKIAKELIKAVNSFQWLGYALFGVVAIYIGAIFATWTIQWLMAHWDKALVMFGCLLVVMTYLVWEES